MENQTKTDMIIAKYEKCFSQIAGSKIDRLNKIVFLSQLMEKEIRRERYMDEGLA